MQDIRCECGKIVCQTDQEYVVIKCRHCKRLILIKKENCIDKAAITPHLVNREQHNYHEYTKAL